jgi:hypothetical protein
MEISFDIDGVPAEFRRSWKTGTAELRSGDDAVLLQSPYRLSTHFRLSTSRVWRCRVGEHDVEIVKVRPRMFGGIRPNSYTVSVDNIIVAKARGM